MTWPRYLEICSYWQQVPPLAETVAGFTGVLGKAAARASDNADDNDALVRELAGLGISPPPELLSAS